MSSGYWSVPRSPRRHRVPLLAGLAALVTLAMGACAPPPDTSAVDLSAEIDTSAVLVVNGERVADATELEAARREGTLSLHSGYGENSEKQVIKAFEQDTGIDVEWVRLVPNRLAERC